jgi:hypothetical protein
LPSTPTGNPIGPPKKDSFKNKRTNPVGRPKGEAGIMKDYRDRMLNSPKSRKVLDSIFKAALDDDHKNQAAAWKIVVDRIVPVSGFEKVAGTNTRNAITVNISGVPGIEIAAEAPLEGEYTDES